MKLAYLSLLAISAHSACLWDVKDEKLYCSWDEGEFKPLWAEQCKPPTPEPMRSGSGTVYCGKVYNGAAPFVGIGATSPYLVDQQEWKVDTRPLVQGGSGTADPAKLVLPAELNLDCVADKAPPKCKPVRQYKDCASPNIVRSSATTEGMLCCDPSVNEIRIHLKCKTEVKP